RHGLGTSDNPVFIGMHDASALVAGATVAAAEAVWTGRSEHALNISGGLHHALAGSASGFCVYNDPAVAIAWLLENGAERVAYVDIDVHHGDGVQAAFYDDPRVLTISIHETPRTLFPGTGFPNETGAEGTSVNVALPPGTGDRPWLRAFDAIVPPLLRRFRPQVLVTSTAPTATRSTRSRTSRSAWTGSAPPTASCTRSRTRRRAAGGSRPGAAATSWCRSCRGSGRTCWPRPRAGRSRRGRRLRRSGASSRGSAPSRSPPAV